MKKLRVIIFISLLIINLSFASADFFGDTWNKLTGDTINGDLINECSDSDGGKIYNIQGRTIGVNINGISQDRTDFCRDNNNIIEYFCDALHNNIVSGELKRCEFGCSNGVCIKESVGLFSGGTKIYVNDSLNRVKEVLTKSQLPTLLKDGTFSGNVDVVYMQNLYFGSKPRVVFQRQPTSEYEPDYVLKLNTFPQNYIYNATITFSKAINFTSPYSGGQIIKLFDKDYSLASGTDKDNLILFEGGQKFLLNTLNKPTTKLTINQTDYIIGLISASDISAIIKVTNPSGISEIKEIYEGRTKWVNGLPINVINADETNFIYSVDLLIGNNVLYLTDGAGIVYGENNQILDGTLVDFGTGNLNNLTRLAISVYAPDSDRDAVLAGHSFIDPVFGTFKLDFSGLNINEVSPQREDIKIYNLRGSMALNYINSLGKLKTIIFAKQTSNGFILYPARNYIPRNNRVYKTILTSKSANILFYQPMITNLTKWGNSADSIKILHFQNAGELIDIITQENDSGIWTFDSKSIITSLDTNSLSGSSSFIIPIGKLNYNLTSVGVSDMVKIYLQDVNDINIENPALVLFEGRDNDGNNNALIVKLENSEKVGVESVQDTWSRASSDWRATSPSNSKIEKRGDLWGSIVSVDSNDADQKIASINYPAEQIYANIYISKI